MCFPLEDSGALRITGNYEEAIVEIASPCSIFL